MVYFRRKVSSRKYAKKRTYKKRTYKKRAMPIKRMIRREIARNVENKTQQNFVLQQDILPSSAATAAFDDLITPLQPDAVGLIISQGTGQGQRIGNRIKIKKLTFKGVIHPTQYNATTNATPAPVMIKMWIFYNKENPTLTPTVKADGDFLQFGNGISGLQNDLMDMFAPVNQDKYRVLTSRIFKLGYASYTGTGALPQQGNLSNNDFNLNCPFSFDLTKHVPKIYEFRDTATNPTTRGLYMMAQAVYANGSQMASATIPAQMSYVQNIEYEDA